MKTFKEHSDNTLAEMSHKNQVQINKKRGDNWEAEIIYAYTNGAVNKIKPKYPYTEKREKIALSLIDGLSKKMKLKKPSKKNSGETYGESKQAVSSIYVRYGWGKSQLAKTDLILDKKHKISLKMYDGSTKTIDSGENHIRGLTALFTGSLEGPLELKKTPSGEMKKFSVKFYEQADKFDNAETPWEDTSKLVSTSGMKWKEFYDTEIGPDMDAPVVNRKKMFHDLPHGHPDKGNKYFHDKQFGEFHKTINMGVVKKLREWNEKCTELLQGMLNSEPNFLYNLTYNEASGTVKFGWDVPGWDNSSMPDAVANWLVVGNKKDGSITSAGELSPTGNSYTRQLANKAKINFNIGLSTGPGKKTAGVRDGFRINKKGNVEASIGGSAMKLHLTLEDCYRTAENYLQEQLSDLNTEMLTEGQLWDKVKSVFGKIKKYLLKVWNSMVKYVGDSWERLFEVFNVEFKKPRIELKV